MLAAVTTPVHSKLEEFGNGSFTLKTRQMFSVHSTPNKFENEAFFPLR